MSIKVYVPREATARALGADAVAGSIAAKPRDEAKRSS